MSTASADVLILPHTLFTTHVWPISRYKIPPWVVDDGKRLPNSKFYSQMGSLMAYRSEGNDEMIYYIRLSLEVSFSFFGHLLCNITRPQIFRAFARVNTACRWIRQRIHVARLL